MAAHDSSRRDREALCVVSKARRTSSSPLIREEYVQVTGETEVAERCDCMVEGTTLDESVCALTRDIFCTSSASKSSLSSAARSSPVSACSCW